MNHSVAAVGYFTLRAVLSTRLDKRTIGAGILSAGLLSCLVFDSPPAIASWVAQRSGSNANLQAVQFPVDANTGYAVGANGTILKTTDGGATWKKKGSGTSNNLLAVYFPHNTTTGYAVGVNGTILKTTDGGGSWAAQSSGTANHLRGVHFPVDANTGYVVGDYGTVLKTINGGATWTTLPALTGFPATVYFSDAQTGYVGSTYGDIEYLYKTTDGGQTWTQVLSDDLGGAAGLSFPADATSGYAASWQKLWKTLDGGGTWADKTFGITEPLTRVHFPADLSTGFVLGQNDAVFKTTDGGDTWTEGRIGTSNMMRGVYFVNNNVGYVVGDAGSIYQTTDGGGGNQLTAFLYPIGPGSVTAFSTVSGCVEHWDCVNDQPGNAAAGIPVDPALITSISDGSGDRDMFALADGVVPSGYRITRIRVTVVTTQYEAPYISVSYQRIGTDPTPVDSTPFLALGGAQSWEWTGLTWTPADLNALEVGVVHSSGPAVEVEQVYVKVFYEPAI